MAEESEVGDVVKVEEGDEHVIIQIQRIDYLYYY